MPTDEVLVVGRIGAPYGVQGWVRLISFTTPQENILNYEPWLLQPTANADWQALVDVRCRKHKKGFVVALQGVSDRDAAAALTGCLVGVPTAVLPPVKQDGEFYWRDLNGCRVVNADGQYLGHVDHLIETGANDVLVLVAETDAKSDAEHQLLIPFAAEYVNEVDIGNRSITVNWDPAW